MSDTELMGLLDEDGKAPTQPMPNVGKNVDVIDEKRVKALAGEINMVIPETTEQCWEDVVRYEKEATQAYAKQGLLLIKLKEEAAHGEFETKLTQLGIGLRSARNAMAITKCLLNVNSSKRQTFAVLGFSKSKMVELSRLAVDAIDSLNDDELSELNELSVRELKKEVKRLKSDNQRLDAERASAVHDMVEEMNRKAPDTQHGLPAWEAQVRKETIAYTEVVNEAVTMMTANISTILSIGTMHPEHQRSAANLVAHTWASIIKRVTTELERLALETGASCDIGSLPEFMDDEWNDIEPERARLLSLFRLKTGGEA